MPRMRKVLIATQRGPVEVEAEVVRLPVGEKQERFFIHDNGTETVLSHYASGWRVGAIDTIRLAAVRWGTGDTITNREAARRLVEDIIAKHGAESVQRTLAQVPVINR